MLKFIILTSPRCGTHMLRSSLISHPNIMVNHELFNDAMGAFHPYTLNEPAQDILKHYAFCTCNEHIQAVGFPLHDDQANQARGKQWRDVWQHLAGMTDIKVIVLYRRNLLRRVTSYLVAQQLRQWCVYPNNQARSPDVRLKLTAEQLTAYFQRWEQLRKQAVSVFENHEQMKVSYEELRAGYDETIAGVQSFLGVPVQTLTPYTIKQGQYALPDILDDYAGLKQQFAGSPWADFFDE